MVCGLIAQRTLCTVPRVCAGGVALAGFCFMSRVGKRNSFGPLLSYSPLSIHARISLGAPGDSLEVACFLSLLGCAISGEVSGSTTRQLLVHTSRWDVWRGIRFDNIPQKSWTTVGAYRNGAFFYLRAALVILVCRQLCNMYPPLARPFLAGAAPQEHQVLVRGLGLGEELR